MTDEELKEALGEEQYEQYKALKAQNRVWAVEDEKMPYLPSGTTHILIIKEGQKPQLKRKRFC